VGRDHRLSGRAAGANLDVRGQRRQHPYTAASRARKGTDWFIARDELGHDGRDATRIRRLADAMRSSRAQTPSLAHPERPEPALGIGLRPGVDESPTPHIVAYATSTEP
jgi:hypothetical protein